MGSFAHAQTPSTPVAPTPTIWRFFGIPQGLQKIRDVSINRRGNFPGLERKPPLKRIGDPANLESPNPAIAEAAKIKQAEDLKAQKIKAIKYLAKMGCGCYDKGGKITDALIAAMDDCTPDVRMAAIEAIETTASGECCKSCGSTSCCNEKVTKRLSEIAYERDDSGCPLEPSAEIRAAAAKALCVCCPNRATGPIEEDVPELEEPEVRARSATADGEGGDDSQSAEGEGAGDEEMSAEGDESAETGEDESTAGDGEEGGLELLDPETNKKKIKKPEGDGGDTSAEELTLQTVKSDRVRVEVGKLKMVGGMKIQPVTFRKVPDWKPTPLPKKEAEPAAKAPAPAAAKATPVEFRLESLPEPVRPAKQASPLPATKPAKALPLKSQTSRKTQCGSQEDRRRPSSASTIAPAE